MTDSLGFEGPVGSHLLIRVCVFDICGFDHQTEIPLGFGGLWLFKQFFEFSLQCIPPEICGNYTAVLVEQEVGRDRFNFIKRDH